MQKQQEYNDGNRFLTILRHLYPECATVGANSNSVGSNRTQVVVVWVQERYGDGGGGCGVLKVSPTLHLCNIHSILSNETISVLDQRRLP